jgi:organic radical activating enzyme
VDRYEVVDGRIINGRCEINVVEHCNLSCRACSHLSPVLPKAYTDPDVIARDLKSLARSYHVRMLRLLGGEPLLHPDLLRVIGAARHSGIGDSIVVVTNGLLLPRMTDEFWASVDAVEVSLYPGRTLSDDARQRCEDRARRHNVAIRFRFCPEFQESYSEVGTRDDDLVNRIFRTCNVAHRWRCHNVIDGWFFRCPQAHYIPRVLHENSSDAYVDGIQIEDDPAFSRKLLSYLESPEPPRACSNCLGTAGKYGPNEQVRRAEFRDRQSAPTEELVHPRLVGRSRVILAELESHIPRRLVGEVEQALLSPRFLRMMRAVQQASRTTLHALDRADDAPAHAEVGVEEAEPTPASGVGVQMGATRTR